MGQTKRHSLIESGTNITIGYILAVCIQILVYPLFDLEVTLGENIIIAAIFTVASVIRSYVLRRAFNHITVKATR